MNIDTVLNQIQNDPHYCKHCNRITQFVFQVAKNTSQGQYQGFVCPDCQHFKGVKFRPYQNRSAYERIYEKDYRDKNFQS